MADPRSGYGTVFRALRESTGLSQRQLAEIAETHDTHLSRIERSEHSPSLDLMCRLVRALGYQVVLTPAGRPLAEGDLLVCDDAELPTAEAV